MGGREGGRMGGGEEGREGRGERKEEKEERTDGRKTDLRMTHGQGAVVLDVFITQIMY